MNVLALIPARAGSKGIPHKNFRDLRGATPVQRALACAQAIGCAIAVTSDYTGLIDLQGDFFSLARPPELAQDDTPMIDVVKHALSEIPGPDDQIVLLLQPTQPLRQPKHLTAAIELLQTSGADSVVSVVEVGLRDAILYVDAMGHLDVLRLYHADWRDETLPIPPRRQGEPLAFKLDGTVYAFTRRTVARYKSIYGKRAVPLIIDPSDTTPLDTPADWARAEELLRAR